MLEHLYRGFQRNKLRFGSTGFLLLQFGQFVLLFLNVFRQSVPVLLSQVETFCADLVLAKPIIAVVFEVRKLTVELVGKTHAAVGVAVEVGGSGTAGVGSVGVVVHRLNMKALESQKKK